MDKYKNISRLAKTSYTSMDTRAMFEETLTDAGYIHVIRKVDLTKRCSCVTKRSDRFNEPDPNCNICDSLGFLYIDYEALAFKSYEAGPEVAATPERMRVNKQAFFVQYDIFEDKDTAEYSRVIELATDGNGNILPGNIPIAEYEIIDAIPYIERGFRIYWKLMVVTREV